MELIDAEALTDFLQNTKDAFLQQALNITDPVVSIKVYAMANAVDMIMDKVLEGPFDIETPDDEKEIN